MMKACNYDSHGLHNVKVSSIKRPGHPKPDELLVRVHCASLNPADWKSCSGEQQMLLSFQWPRVFGFDFSGTIEEIHPSNKQFEIGDEVFGMISGLPQFEKGTCAEYVLVPLNVVARKPKNISHKEAAAMPLVCITAIKMFRICGLRENKKGKAGSKIFITGGAGGMGTACIQLAKKLYGASHVTTTASKGKKTDVCKALGADRVINYREQDFEKVLEPSEFDCILDCTGEASRCVSLLKEGGGMCSILAGPSAYSIRTWLNESGWSKSKITFGVYSFLNGFLSPIFDLVSGGYSLKNACEAKGATFGHVIGTGSSEIMNIIANLMEKDQLKAVIDQTFSLDDSVEAIAHQKAGRCVGKVVIEIIKS